MDAIQTLNGHTSYVCCCAVSPNRKWILSGSDDETLMIWDVESGACTKTLNGHTGTV